MVIFGHRRGRGGGGGGGGGDWNINGTYIEAVLMTKD